MVGPRVVSVDEGLCSNKLGDEAEEEEEEGVHGDRPAMDATEDEKSENS